MLFLFENNIIKVNNSAETDQDSTPANVTDKINQEALAETTNPPAPGPVRTWANASEGDLAKLQSNRHSKSTAGQMRWAVKLFRGMFIVLLMAPLLY